MIWAPAIADQTLRSNLTAHAAARWLMDDPKKAEAWIRKPESLNAEQKEDILEEARGFRSVTSGEAGKWVERGWQRVKDLMALAEPGG